MHLFGAYFVKKLKVSYHKRDLHMPETFITLQPM
jgi:hypothetical protein